MDEAARVPDRERRHPDDILDTGDRTRNKLDVIKWPT